MFIHDVDRDREDLKSHAPYHLIVVTTWRPLKAKRLQTIAKQLVAGGGLIWAQYAGTGTGYCMKVFQKDPTTRRLKRLENSFGLPISLL